jgi:hypothetical protein
LIVLWKTADSVTDTRWLKRQMVTEYIADFVKKNTKFLPKAIAYYKLLGATLVTLQPTDFVA